MSSQTDHEPQPSAPVHSSYSASPFPDQPQAAVDVSSQHRLPSVRISTFIGILHLLIGLIGAGVISAFALYFIYQSGEQTSLREVEDLAFIVDNVVKDLLLSYQAGQMPIDEIKTVVDRYLENRPEMHYAILHTDGTPYFRPEPSRDLPDINASSPEFRAAIAETFSPSIRENAQGEKYYYVATIIDRGSRVYGVLILAAPFDVLMNPTYQIMRWMCVVALLIVIVTVLEGWIGSHYISQPLTRLTQVAESLSRGNLKARAEPEGPAEVIHLAVTLNEMAGRLQNSLESLRGFVANASHELRTPLTAIKLQVSALRSAVEEDPEAATYFLDKMDGEIDRLAYTVNEMLDLSQIEGGGTTPHFQPVYLPDLASEVLAFWEARAHQVGLTLTLTTESSLPRVKGDPYQLRRLFDNLLDNAIKNTPSGGVEIVLRVCPPESQHQVERVRLEFRDTGIGIPPEHLPRLFDRFYRVDPRKPAGVSPTGGGLGLAIAQSIAVAHGGKIGVTSQVGVGSTFWVELLVYA